MPPERTYWLIETQSEGVKRFYGSADECALQQACRYASTAPQPMLRIQERAVGDEQGDQLLRRLDWLALEDLCGTYWD